MSLNTGYIMTLANSIIGVGILAMPFCFQKCGILLSILLLALSNAITRLACHYLLKSSIKARRKNFEFLASYIFGSSGKLMVELCVIGYLMGTCITYFVVVGDLGPQFIAKLFNVNSTDSLRTFIMILVTIFCIIPLCLLRNIESLSLMCISSIIFYFCLVLKIFFESESKMVTNSWYNNVWWWRPSGITQCLPIFSMALSCQMQTFEIYESLPNQTIDKMNHIIKYGTGICTMVYICVGFFGYVAFHDQHFSGNVLLSLSPSLASDIIQMGFVLSVAVSFPLVIFPCRASLYSLLYHRSHSDTAHYIPEHRFKYITISMVLVALIMGILIPSIELIIGLVGSTIGVAICIMFPASCFIKINKKNSTERLAAQFLLVFGFLIMILGTYANLGAIDDQQSGANIPIDRLPDIHITPSANDDPFIAQAKIKALNKQVEIGPQEPVIDIVYDSSGKLSKPRSRKTKPSKITTPSESIRESNAKIEKDESPPMKDAIESKHIESVQQPSVNTLLKSIDVPKPNRIASQLSESTTDKKPSDSVINNEAIQREEQEIAINAKENVDTKLTKEMLDQVKSQLTRENEKNQKLVLERINEKINEISEKVNNIAQMQDRSASGTKSKDTSLPKNQVQNKISASTTSNDAHLSKNEEKIKSPPLPVAKLLVDRQSSVAPNQTNEKQIVKPDGEHINGISVNSDMKKPAIVTASKQVPKKNDDVLPQKIEKTNENIGRDILSNSNDYQAASSNNISIKTEN
ncbi:putative sodium-coupled neutral amino acid transporter 10 [Contarinia nasturtii]|uniref:putative sodium-coupled neutral amino acid transporter 10 n=1 Tax=Contarinia nasturtii TaxID=265458 RepID=UPI0012D44BCA|nr:putative sodium-coupled neutral amino acid transporter 10 [Contarinia nasturtii]XP_031630115.1 putative sodium-coupled neutral amino acid transporter 10 [Contarinia nasturtii]